MFANLFSPPHVRFATLCTLGIVTLLPMAAQAGPAEVIYSPIVEYREWELELKSGWQDWGNPDLGERAAKLAVGYGVAPRWGVEVEAEYSQVPGEVAHVEEYEFENIFQLTEHGEHWLDAGIFTELSHNRLDHSNALTIGPMLQHETAHTQTNLNVYFARQLSAVPRAGEESDAGPHNEIQYQAQWKFDLSPRFQPGVQAFGSLGDPTHLHSNELKIGPAFFGAASLSDGKKIRYNAAIMGGLTRGTPDTTVRFQLEYEFY